MKCLSRSVSVFMTNVHVVTKNLSAVMTLTNQTGRARQQHWAPIEREWTLITSAQTDEPLLAPFRAL